MMSRPLPYFAQEKDYSCGPASMRMALGSFGMQTEERALRRRMKTDFIFGTRHHHLAHVAEENGLYARVKKNATFTDLEQALMRQSVVIVNFVEPTASASHYAPVVSLNETSVVLNDPYRGAELPMPREEFWKRWQSQNRFGKGNWYKGWMIEIAPLPFND